MSTSRSSSDGLHPERTDSGGLRLVPDSPTERVPQYPPSHILLGAIAFVTGTVTLIQVITEATGDPIIPDPGSTFFLCITLALSVSLLMVQLDHRVRARIRAQSALIEKQTVTLIAQSGHLARIETLLRSGRDDPTVPMRHLVAVGTAPVVRHPPLKPDAPAPPGEAPDRSEAYNSGYAEGYVDGIAGKEEQPG